MPQDSRTFLDIPTAKGIQIAIVVIVVFMALAAVLYGAAGNSLNQYLSKIGDSFIQGSIVSILFAILKTVIDNAKLRGS